MHRLHALVSLVRPGGWLIVTVPAHQALWGTHDRRLHHLRRYGRRQLLDLFAGCDVDLVRTTPFNIVLSPLAIIYRVGERTLGMDFGNQERNLLGPLNAALGALFRLESMLIRRGMPIPFGLSYVAVFRRRTCEILVTGAAGFINGYLVPELFEAGHDVIGVDDFRKYGRLTKSYDDHPCYRFVEGDAKDVALLTELAADCDQVVAAAAMIGGISYFHEFAYDLLAENERILASTFDAAIAAHESGHLERIVVVSSSMVYESARSSRRPRGPS